MEQARFLWDQFTSGNANRKHKKIREQQELEEKLRIEEKQRQAIEREKNQKLFRQ